jgi:phospholipid/cholesterol/gamma-HCH transport system substrate-binding protein
MPAKKHDFTKAEIAAGAMVLVSAVVFVLFAAVVMGLRPPGVVNAYYCHFKDTSGMNPGADVRYGGLKVGRVADIAIEKDNPSLLKVVVHVAEDVFFNADSTAYVGQVSLTSDKHLEVTTGSSGAAPLPPGSEIPTTVGGLTGVINQAASDVGAISGKVSALLDDARTLLGVKVREQKEGKGDGDEIVSIADLLYGLDETVEEGKGVATDFRAVLGDSRDDIEKMIQGLPTLRDKASDLLTSLDEVVGENRASLRGAVADAEQIAANVARASERLDELVATVQAALHNTEALTADAQSVLADNRQLVESLLLDLQEIVRNLKAFARIIAEQPESIIRGQSPKGR